MSEELVKECLSLSLDEKKQLIARIKESFDGHDSWRADRLLEIWGGVTGRKPDIFSRDKEDVWAKTMVAYQLLEEGYSLESVARQLCRKDHSSVIHYRQKMKDALDVPQAYRDIIPIWNEFQKRIQDDIHKGTTENPVSLGGEFPDCSQGEMGKESGEIRTPGDI